MEIRVSDRLLFIVRFDLVAVTRLQPGRDQLEFVCDGAYVPLQEQYPSIGPTELLDDMVVFSILVEFFQILRVIEILPLLLCAFLKAFDGFSQVLSTVPGKGGNLLHKHRFIRVLFDPCDGPDLFIALFYKIAERVAIDGWAG